MFGRFEGLKENKKTKHQSSLVLFKTRTPFFQNLKRQILGKRGVPFFFNFFEEKGVSFFDSSKSSSTTAISDNGCETTERRNCGYNLFISAAFERAATVTEAATVAAAEVAAAAAVVAAVVAALSNPDLVFVIF